MKNQILKLLAISAAVLMAACGKDPDPYTVPAVSVDPTSISLAAEAASQQVTLTVNRSWSATASADWIDVSPSSATINNDKEQQVKVTISVAANTGALRSGTVKFVAGSVNCTLAVEQAGAGSGDRDYTELSAIRGQYKGSDVVLAADTWIKGTVISNYRKDTNGGINNGQIKNMIVSDPTAGIALRLAAENTEFARGDEVEINVGGLTLTSFNGALQIGDIPLEVIAKLSTTTPEAKVISAADLLTGKYESQYVAVSNVQVSSADLSKTYVMNGKSTSINMEAQSGEKFVLFSSSYSSFASTKVPQGSGTLKGIANVYNGTYQIGLTTLDDVAGMTGERFGGSSAELAQTTIAKVNASMTTSKASVGDYYLIGVVSTDFSKGNYAAGNLMIQDKDAKTAGNGIMVYMYGADFTSYALGDEVRVDLSAASSQKYNKGTGAYCNEIIITSTDAVTKTGNKHTIAAVTITPDQIEAYQGMYVAIDNSQAVDKSIVNWAENTSKFTAGDVEYPVYVAKTCTDIIGKEFLKGVGTLKGVAYVYGGGGTAQICPRDYTDVSGLTGAVTEDYVSLDPKTLTWEAKDLTAQTITVTSNCEWAVEATTIDWCKVTADKAAKTITVEPTSANDTESDKTATVTVKYGDAKTATVTLTQKAKVVTPEGDVLAQVGFEESEGFKASTTFNNTEEKTFGSSSALWGTLCGTVATTNIMTGSQSMQMRWYKSKDVICEAYMKYDVENVKAVMFQAANTNSNNVKVSYSTDQGATWTGEKTFTLTTDKANYTYNIDAQGKTVRLKFTIVLPESPTDKSRLYIDDVTFYGTKGGSSLPTLPSEEI